MNSALLVSVLTMFVTLVFMYLDSKLLDNPKSKFTYLKNMILVGGISYAIVYFMGNPSVPSQLGGNAPYCATSVISSINEEIMTGLPNF